MTKVRFGADEYQLKSTWDSSVELAEKVGDPLQMAFNINKGTQVLTAVQVVNTIWIGLKAAGEKLTVSEVGVLCHSNGLIDYMTAAGEYIIDTVTQGTEESSSSDAVDEKK